MQILLHIAVRTVCRSKSCTVRRVPCERKADLCKFLSVQIFVRTRVNGVPQSFRVCFSFLCKLSKKYIFIHNYGMPNLNLEGKKETNSGLNYAPICTVDNQVNPFKSICSFYDGKILNDVELNSL